MVGEETRARPLLYVAARLAHKAQARVLARRLDEEGGRVVARWLARPEDNDADLDRPARAAVARQCLEDVALCDAVVLLNPPTAHHEGTGGCHVEVGVALALWKPVVVVGPPSNIFHDLDQVAFAAGPRTAIRAVEAILPVQQARLLRWSRERRAERRAARAAARREAV